MSQLFWLAITIACLVWYSTVTIHIAVFGARDIAQMLRNLAGQKSDDMPP